MISSSSCLALRSSLYGSKSFSTRALLQPIYRSSITSSLYSTSLRLNSKSSFQLQSQPQLHSHLRSSFSSVALDSSHEPGFWKKENPASDDHDDDHDHDDHHDEIENDFGQNEYAFADPHENFPFMTFMFFCSVYAIYIAKTRPHTFNHYEAQVVVELMRDPNWVSQFGLPYKKQLFYKWKTDEFVTEMERRHKLNRKAELRAKVQKQIEEIKSKNDKEAMGAKFSGEATPEATPKKYHTYSKEGVKIGF